MNLYPPKGRDAVRPALAALVLAATFLACLWLAGYKDWTYNNRPGLLTVNHFAPGWAVPVAIAVGIGGAAGALLILRVHRHRR